MFTAATVLSILTLTRLIHADRPVDWFEINCPGSSGDQSCTYTNQNDVDIAVSLFFQTEDQSGSSFQCIGGTRAAQVSKPFTCPSPMEYSFKNYWSYCLLEDLTFPSDLSKVQEYCDYVDQGYEGFTFSKSDFPNYKCPSSMRQGENNDGTVFCTYDLPSTTTSNLPNDTQPFCTQQAFEAGELGFRFNNNGSTPTPTSHTAGTVYCSRAWDGSQEGAAGDCYFILPAKESFSCSGSGTTNVIGAHAVKLAKSNFDSTSTNIKSVNYTNSNKDKDQWVYLEIESAGKNVNSIQCSYETSNNAMINVCNFTAEAAASSRYSCNFALPAGKTMNCNQMGDIYVSSAVVRTMTSSMFNAEPAKGISLCPNKTYPDSTFCDCAFENPSLTDDMLIIMEAVNMDNQFDSYHCYVWGVNMCAWGANNNNLNDAGGCYFVLPAGAMYNCSMQWGSTSFLSSTAIKLDGTLYTKPTAVSVPPSAVKPDGAKLPDSREYLEMEQLFYKWMSRHDKNYKTYAEEFERFDNFRQFVSLVDNNNHGIKVDEIKSEAADLTMDEFNDLYRDCAIPASMYDKERNAWKVPSDIDMDNLPTSVDWRTKGALTPVKNQGQCGSCWAFSTTGVLESHWEILTGELQSLSEEDLVDCDRDDGNDGCGGGWPYKAITYVQKNGIDTEASYNYTAGNGDSGSCKAQDGQKADISGHVTGYQFVESDEDAMAAYVANYGPISISLDAMTQLWWPYTDQSGIMTGCCNKEVDHAVLIVGYGTGSKSNFEEADMPYWIIKNSWGTDWGYDGYIYLQRGTDQCGITYQPVVPELKK